MPVNALLNEPIRIAPRPGGGHWTVEDWRKIDFGTEEGWQEAINIGEARLDARFFQQIDLIKNIPYAGFAVMALDCLLIETLQQFFDGKHETDSKKNESAFCRFLTETSFKKHFSKSSASKFYKLIRNGILHQAEIKGTSRIVIRPHIPLVTRISNGLVINREEFHKQLEIEFENYIKKLRNTPADLTLRGRFKNKMDAICNETGP
jgi:hypothetical protein